MLTISRDHPNLCADMRSSHFVMLALAASTASAQEAPRTTLHVDVDPVKQEVIVTAGPFDLANSPMMPGMSHGMMHMAETNMMRFEWPADGSLRGVDLTLRDANGNPLPIKILHHLAMYNFDRRGLIHTSIERLFAWGQDTQAILLPSGVGVPLPEGTHLGFLIGWHNDTGHDIHDAYLRMTLPYVPPKKVKVAVFPWYLDVHNVDGGNNSFDLPAGRSTQRFNFQVPLAGRLIAVGGHMHDYAKSVRLVDSASGKVLIKLKSIARKDGTITGTQRWIYGFHDDAVPIEAHHTYTLVSEYDNVTGKPIEEGGMSQLNGIFQPDSMALWPKIDFNDPGTIADLKSLPPDLGSDEADEHAHDHMHMDMPMPAKDTTTAKPPRMSRASIFVVEFPVLGLSIGARKAGAGERRVESEDAP